MRHALLSPIILSATVPLTACNLSNESSQINTDSTATLSPSITTTVTPSVTSTEISSPTPALTSTMIPTTTTTITASTTATITTTVTVTITATLPPTITPTPYPLTLNDTGISKCYDNQYELENCVSINFIGQDNNFGRDAEALAGTLEKIGAGNAGFDFTKLDSDGNELADNTEGHSCVRDNHTQLIWLTNDALANQKFTWYENINGEFLGEENLEGCNLTSCTSTAAVNHINEFSQPLCGIDDWRLPNTQELLSIVDYSKYSPPINLDYFPNIGPESVLSLDYGLNDHGLTVNALSLNIGSIISGGSTSLRNIMLVRSADDE